MKPHNIDLKTFIPKGHVISEITDGELKMTTTEMGFKREGMGYKVHGNEMNVPAYIYLPEKYKLPLCIDLTVKINTPSLHIMLGSGRISFGRDWNNSINFTDISGESHDSGRLINNYIPYNEYFTVSMLFDTHFMRIKINDEIRYYSTSEKYMKSKVFPKLNSEGLEIKITCNKRSELWIKNCTVTEYEDDVPECNAEEIINGYPIWIQSKDKPKFEYGISKLSKELQDEMIKTNDFILSLKPLKLKRKVEAGYNACKITYVSEYGFSYKISVQWNTINHCMWWIIYTTHREQQKYGGVRKRNLITETLNKLAETSPEFADKMESNLRKCDGCQNCAVKTPYEYKGKKKISCHGLMEFAMIPSDFIDVRKVIETINEILFTV